MRIINKAVYYFGWLVIILLLFMLVFGGELHFRINDPVTEIQELIDAFRKG